MILDSGQRRNVMAPEGQSKLQRLMFRTFDHITTQSIDRGSPPLNIPNVATPRLLSARAEQRIHPLCSLEHGVLQRKTKA
jgi:hypothetical protein